MPAKRLTASLSSQEKSKEECEKIADTIGAVEELPVSCRNYGDIVQKLRSGTAKDRADNPFEGLSAGQAVEATRARKQGGESQAQIQRRLTNPWHGLKK